MALQILLAGRSRQDLEALEGLLGRQPNVALTTRHITNGHSDPLYGIEAKPELLVLSLSPLWEEELKALAERSPATRPPVLVVGPGNDVQVMRKAMQAGARDFLARPAPEQELVEVLRQVAKDQQTAGSSAPCQLTAVINAKGGAGATVLASNLAHLMVVEAKQKTVLLDLDFQFGVLPLYFDLRPQHSLVHALDAVEGLDAVALEGYVAKHTSGLHLLGTMVDHLLLTGEVSGDHVARLVDLLVRSYRQVVVDLPRQIDPLTGIILERADRILIVIQQSLTDIRAAKRLMSVLTDGLAVPRHQITVVVNRYEPKSKIRLGDIEEALGRISLELVPNDYKRVENSVNLGVPLHDLARNAPITRSLAGLALKLSGTAKEKTGLFGRVFASFV